MLNMYEIATLRITGADAFEFLQGQLTNDLRRLETVPEILAAWCDPKGRVIWFGTVRSVENGYALAVPDDRAGGIVQRLTMFRFRSKVEFDVVEEKALADPAILVADGSPYIGEEQAGKFTPHMLNLDLLDAISFEKGCYTGQEIVARTHYKGATKRRTLRFSCDGPVPVGHKVQLDGRDVGEVLNVAGNELLAVVPLEEADSALTVNGMRLTRRQLPYM